MFALSAFLVGLALAWPGGGGQTLVQSQTKLTTDAVPLQVAAGGNFSTYLGNPERTSGSSQELLINLTTAPSLHELWVDDLGSSIRSQPIAYNGTVYIGLGNGSEDAISATDHQTIWSRSIGTDSHVPSSCDEGSLGVSATATYSSGALYVDGGNQEMYSLDAASGAVIWQRAVGGEVADGYYDWSSPLVVNGTDYVGLSGACSTSYVAGGLKGFSTKSGTPTGSFNASAPDPNGSSIEGAPTFDPATGGVVVATGPSYGSAASNFSSSLVLLNTTTTGAWAVAKAFQVPPSPGGAPTGFLGTPTYLETSTGESLLVAANENGDLYALNASTLSLVWSRAICCSGDVEDTFSTSFGGGQIFALTPETTVKDVQYGSTVRSIDPTTGAIAWTDGFNLTPVVEDAAPLWFNRVLVVPDQSELLFLNAVNGSVIRNFTGQGMFDSPASVSHGEVFAGTTGGSLYAFDLNLTAGPIRAGLPAGNAPLNDTFFVNATGGLPPYRYSWNFGDGLNSTAQDPSTTFPRGGLFNVTVTVTDLAGSVASDIPALQIEVFGVNGSAPPTKHLGLVGLPHLEGDAVAGAIGLAILLGVVVLWRRHERSKAPPSPPVRWTSSTPDNAGAGAPVPAATPPLEGPSRPPP